MSLLELFIVAVGLSMDAFAVSICKGLSLRTFRIKNALVVGAFFGVFQALMPLIGYFIAGLFADKINAFDHWIAFGLLVFIGVRMIKESFDDACCEDEDPAVALRWSLMLTLAIATSIDALAVGVTFAFLSVNIWVSAFIIGITTFLFSFVGVKIGSVFGTRFKSKAEFAGGLILILIGIKILLEHLGVLNF